MHDLDGDALQLAFGYGANCGQPKGISESDFAILDGLDIGLKREKLAQIERINRIDAEDEAARRGRFTDAAEARRQMTAAVAQVVHMYEGKIPETATALAARFGLDEREVRIFLVEDHRRFRANGAERASQAAAALPRFVEVEVAAVSPDRGEPSSPGL